MKDEGLQADTTLSSSQSAVKYILQRIRVNADLRWHMLGTESFSLLCAAEAERSGKPNKEIKERYSEMEPSCRHDRPQLVELREQIKKMEGNPDTDPDTERELAEEKKTNDRLRIKLDTLRADRDALLLNFIQEHFGRRARVEAEFTIKLEASCD